jgi:hypothetical protein
MGLNPFDRSDIPVRGRRVPPAAIRQNRVMETLEPGPYMHFKGGRYDVVGEARHSESEERMAVYRSADGSLWVRPLDMFLGEAMVGGVAVPRFAKL